MLNTSLFERDAALTAVTGVGGPLNTVNATPYNAPFTPNARKVLADISGLACTFTGSAPKVVTWSATAVGPGDLPFKESQLLLWIATAAPASPEYVYGVYYDDGTNLLGVDPFDAPIKIEKVGDSFQHIATAP